MFSAHMSEVGATSANRLPSKGEVTTVELDRHERLVARRSAEARAIVPQVEFAVEVDMKAALGRVRQLGCDHTALLVEAAAQGLRAVRRVNGAYRDGHYELYERINVGITFAQEGLYVIPVLFDADTKSVPEISAELEDLEARAREGGLAPAELSGATFTLSTAPAGSGVATLTPLIVPPQAASLAAGPVREVPVVREGRVVPGHTMGLTLACDHRIVYGSHAAAFLAEVRSHLEEGMS